MKISHPFHLADEDNKMTMKIGALLILAGLGCFVAFNLLGSTLDAQGFLHEPFALLPLGYLLLFTGMQGEIVNILLKIKNSFLPTKQILIGL
ncbi:DUF3955 domain-containing protein, partial [Aeromonas sp. 25-281]